MKTTILGCIAAFIQIFSALPVYSSDCSGGWNVLPNYQPGLGGPCKLLGLDTNRGVCQPGYAYETLCDDASNGRYRTCQGPRRCSGGYDQGPPQNVDCRYWDYKRNRPCPSGRVNNDCRGDCESLPYQQQPQQYPQQNVDCRYWDYRQNRPCPPGYINKDCQGGCGRM